MEDDRRYGFQPPQSGCRAAYTVHFISAFYLLAALDDESALVVSSVAIALARLGDTLAAPDMLDKLISPDSSARERRMAAIALGELRYAPAVGPLISVLGDSDASARAEAARALGNLGDREAFRPLTSSLSDEAPRVRAAAVQALGGVALSQEVRRQVAGLRDDEAPMVRQLVARMLEEPVE